MNTVVLRREMGAIVLEHLRQFAELPDNGVVAGQAVASALDDLFGNGGGVYNDIDVFQAVRPNHRVQVEDSANKASRLTHRVDVCQESGYDRMLPTFGLRRSYSIQSVHRHDMLNVVRCALSDELPRPARTFISGFDLNCTRVAVDLRTQALVWDGHFERFWHSRQLEIALLHTPWHTMLRLLKKLDELPNTYADVEASFMVAASLSASPAYEELRSRGFIGPHFGRKHQEQAVRFARQLQPYFALQETRLVRLVTPHGGLRRWTTEAASDEAHDKKTTLWSLEPRGQVPAALQARVDALGSLALVDGAATVYAAFKKRGASVHVKFQALAEQLRARELPFARQSLALQQERYVKGQALPSVAEQVEAFVKKHPHFAPKLLLLPLSQQAQAIRVVQEACRSVGEDARLAFGLVETSHQVLNLLDLEVLSHEIQELLQADKAPIDVKPLWLPTLPRCFENYEVLELLTPAALREEGLHQNHCVGGYTNLVRRNFCRILSIRHRPSGQRTTVELEVLSSGQLAVRQHRGRFNKSPQKAFVDVLSYVLPRLNMAQKHPRLRSWPAALGGLLLLSRVRAGAELALRPVLSMRNWLRRKRSAQCPTVALADFADDIPF